MPINWETFFADHVTVEDTKKIYTANAALQLRKCYEVIARVNNGLNDTFRIVIDTETHEVIKTEKLY